MKYLLSLLLAFVLQASAYAAGTIVCQGGTCTSNQTVTLTGDVTGSGAGSVTTTIAANAVALGTDTTGNYASSVTANQGLLLTGTEGASVGLIDCAATEILKRNAGDTAWECAADGGGGAPTDATYITQTANGTLSAEQALGALATGILKSTTTSGVLSIAVAGTDYTSPSSTETFTNKTYDVEGTGNTFTIYDEIWRDAAGCNNTTPGPVWNSNTANVPAFICEGTNIRLATADFDDTTDEAFDGGFRLPTGFTGAIDAIFRWKAAATTGAAGWCFQLVRVPTAATSDPALPAQAAGNCVSSTVAGTTLQEVEATISGVTCTSCAAGDRVNFRLSRDANGGAVTDSMTGDAKLLGWMTRVRRTL